MLWLWQGSLASRVLTWLLACYCYFSLISVIFSPNTSAMTCFYVVCVGTVGIHLTQSFSWWLFDTFSDLRTTRERLLEMFTDVTCNSEMMKNATDAYFSLLQGKFTQRICLIFYSSLCLLRIWIPVVILLHYFYYFLLFFYFILSLLFYFDF